MKKITIIFLSIILTACAAKNKAALQDSSLIKVSEPQIVSESLPDDFEKTMPSSSIIRSSLIIFEHAPSRVYSDSDVQDMAANDKLVAVLKPGELNFTMPLCPSLVLDGDFTKVGLDGFNAVVYGQGRIDIFSSYECVRFASIKRALRGGVLLIGDYILEWGGSTAVMRKAFGGDILFNGDTGIGIASGGLIGGKPVLVHENGYITVFNEKIKAFTLGSTFPVSFNTLYFAGNTFYGTTKNGEFFTIDDNKTNITNQKNCNLSPSSPYAICGGELIGGSEVYKDMPAVANFSSGAGLYLTLKDNNLNIYTLNSLWQRFVSFGYSSPEVCAAQDGAVYFTSFSGDTIKLFKGEETVAEQKPEQCGAGVVIADGKFVCGGVECGVFASEVNSDASGVMYKRKEGEKVFYYFSNIMKEPAGIGTPE